MRSVLPVPPVKHKPWMFYMKTTQEVSGRWEGEGRLTGTLEPEDGRGSEFPEFAF